VEEEKKTERRSTKTRKKQKLWNEETDIKLAGMFFSTFVPNQRLLKQAATPILCTISYIYAAFPL
jgi:hypothetical protein